jgi:hypothetical protein
MFSKIVKELNQQLFYDKDFINEFNGSATCEGIANFLIQSLKVKCTKTLLELLTSEIDKHFVELHKADQMPQYVPANPIKNEKFGKVEYDCQSKNHRK